MKSKGFTLLELLVVVAIIGLIATIANVFLQDAREKAIATAMLTDFRAIEKALKLSLQEENRNRWWTEEDLLYPPPPAYEFSTNPAIEDLWDCTNGLTSGYNNCIPSLKTFIPVIPTIEVGQGFGIYTRSYYYDQGGTYAPPGGIDDGVHLFIRNCESCQNIFDELDRIVDNSDGPSAGKATYSGIPPDVRIRYNIGIDDFDF